MARVIPHARDLVDELGHTRQRPQLRAVADDARALQKRLLDLIELIGRYARPSPGSSRGAKTLAPLVVPRLSPAHRRRSTYSQPTRDRGLCLSPLEQPNRSHPASFESRKITTCHPGTPRVEGSTVTLLRETL